MYAVEFETKIDNGVVLIPERFKSLNNSKKAKIIVMVDDTDVSVENKQPIFTKFLQTHQHVTELSLLSREECHER